MISVGMFVCLRLTYIPPEQYLHEQITTMHSAFSRFNSQGRDAAIDKEELSDFLGFVVSSRASSVDSLEENAMRSKQLVDLIVAQLPSEVSSASAGGNVELTSACLGSRNKNSLLKTSCVLQSASSCIPSQVQRRPRTRDWVCRFLCLASR